MGEVLTNENLDTFIYFQRIEATQAEVYEKLSKAAKDNHNSQVFHNLSQQEMQDYRFWKKYTKSDVKAFSFKVAFYYFCAMIFGLTFGVKLMERSKISTQKQFLKLLEKDKKFQFFINQEEIEEKKLLEVINEEKLNYMGSIVLGLNDALIELTGILSGITFAMQNSRTVIISALVTGIVAALSMAASEYLSSKAEGAEKNAIQAAAITGLTYIVTVALLVFPYLILANLYQALIFTLFNAFIIILIFNFYIAVAKDLNFKVRFLEMIGISFSVSALSFIIGILINKYF